VLVRVLTHDDPAQVRAARDLLSTDDSFLVPMTVLLETGWGLEALYDLAPGIVADSLRRFLGLPNVEVRHPAEVAQALQWYEEGLDVADAVHFARSQDADPFATFDPSFAHGAVEQGRCPVVPIKP